jgi:outer membrane biosynthesis protein TonB
MSRPVNELIVGQDHFYICIGHTKDSSFCQPDPEEAAAAAARKKKEELDAEIEKVKKEYDEKQKLKREKRKEEKSKDKDMDAKKKEEDQDKEDEKANSDKVRTISSTSSMIRLLIDNLYSLRNCPSQRMSRKSILDLAYTL